jgi:ribose transport system substrate-binding protein
MKRLLIPLLASTASIFIAGAAAAQTIPVIVKDTTSPFWQTVMAGACEAGKALGAEVNLLGPQSESDVAGQVSILENAVSQNPDVIVLAPTSFDGLGPAVDEASQSVPIIAVDSKANSDGFKSLLATDNVLGGQLGAEALAKAIEKMFGEAKGDVAIISYGPGASTLDERIRGFNEGLAKYPDLKVVTTRVGDFQTTKALTDTTDVLTANPNLRGIFADALFTGLGAGQAIAEAGKTGQIALVTFDSSDQLEKYIRDGVAQALVVQDPYRMGYGGVEFGAKLAKDETIPEFVDTGVEVITPENVDSERAQELLHPDLSCISS